MVATDTVVGVVGALVLIAVMVGVFAYEYNQADEDPDGADDGRLSDFEQRFGFLAPQEDIDGDGVANVDDDDLDGDGTNNTDDADVVVETSMTGMIGPVGEVRLVLGFEVGTGNRGIVAEAIYSIVAPPPLPPQPDLRATLTVGNETAEGETAFANTQATSVAAFDAPVAPGSGTFELAENETSAAPTSATLRVLVTYGP